MKKLNIKQIFLTFSFYILLNFQAVEAKPWDNLNQGQVITVLEDKFENGLYSKKGADTCLVCHKRNSKVMAIFSSPHGSMSDNSPMIKLQCETCHGPLGKHNRKGKEPMIDFGPDAVVPSKLQDSICLSCHQDEERQRWHASIHKLEDVACTSCHKVHTTEDPILTNDEENQVCTQCHSKQKMQMHQRSSHPLKWNEILCSDCHSPHGSQTDNELKNISVGENCFECHPDKRGPYLWEHEPVINDCSTCHSPHGSTNDNLLKARPPFLCQQCHNSSLHSSSGNVTSSKSLMVSGGSCLNCHAQIHGSNHIQGKALNR